MTVLKKILNNLEFEYLVEFLPEWQKRYFLSESLIESRQQLSEYILSSAYELIDDKTKLVFLLLKLDNFHREQVIKLVSKGFSFDQLIISIRNNELDKKSILNIKDFLGISLEKNSELTENKDMFEGPKIRFFELLDYQVYVKEQLLTIINSENDVNRVVVHMPTGTGKTKTSMHTLVEYYLNTLQKQGLIIWVAHTNTLLEQAEETLENVWGKLGVGSINVYRLYSKYNDIVSIKSTGVLFIGVQKLIQISKKDEELSSLISEITRLVIFDEAHKSTAYETKKAIQRIIRYKAGVRKALIGLTATPGRNANEEFSNIELAEFYNKNIITINPLVIEQLRVTQFKAFNQNLSKMNIISYFQERRILAKLKREILEYDDNEINKKITSMNTKLKNYDDLPPEVVRVFSENIHRNSKIIERIEQLVNDKKQIILFACSVEHGKFLTSVLQVKKIKAKEVYGETQSFRRVEIIKQFKRNEINVLINCGVLTTGFDSTNINCVFITRPTNSVVLYSQMIGRGLRGPKMGGNEECLLVDMKDNLSKFKNDDEIFKYFNNYWG